MAELVDALDLGSSAARRGGSSPSTRTSFLFIPSWDPFLNSSNMLVERKDIDKLNIQLGITIDPDDYKEAFDTQLQKQGKKVQLKGFRKGKVPKSYLKKVFGKSVLAEVVLSKTSDSLSGYIQENELSTLGRPLPSSSHDSIDFDPNNLETYKFTFDIGLEPEFDVKGVESTDSYVKPKVIVDDAMITDELDRARLRMGKEVEVESGAEENDRIQIEAKEKDGEDVRTATFHVLMSMLGDSKVKKTLQSSKVGDVFEFNPFTLEKDATSDHVKKHILGLEEDDDGDVSEVWTGQILAIKRIEKADLDETFFKNFFGEEIQDEASAREAIKNEIEAFYNRQGEALLFRSFQDRLLEVNDVDMPADFLKRWLESEKVEQNAQQEEQVSTEVGDEELGHFLKGLRWTIIRDKIAEKGEVEVSEDELTQYFVNNVKQYLGAYAADEALITHSAQRLMQNPEQVRKAYETIKDDKVFKYISDQVKVNTEDVTKDELEKRIEEVRQS